MPISQTYQQKPAVKSFSQLIHPGFKFVYHIVYVVQSRLKVCVPDKIGNAFKTIILKTLLNHLNPTMYKQIVSTKITKRLIRKITLYKV